MPPVQIQLEIHARDSRENFWSDARARPLGRNADGTEPGEHQLRARRVARIGEGSSLFEVRGL